MSKAKVLIVEDDAFAAMSMRAVLTLIGLEVVGVASCVNDALCLAENTGPDLAIFDVRLGGRRDGIEGAMILRGTIGLPVIFVTGQSDPATIARAAEAEPVAYLSKPVASSQLVAAIENALTNRR